jgi:phosphatidylglycerol---prolipoprotein diacylglyceryl transferase
MFDFFPSSTALQLGPLTIAWYGIGYALGLAAAYAVMVRLARRAGEDPEILANAMIVVAIAALIGGRAYHVIDQWQLYKDDLLKIILPPYSGLGVYGGIITGTIAAWWWARRIGAPFLRWADIVAPGLFAMQAIARWGNFFNQELYGSPTTAPWGIPIDCAHRILDYPCTAFPEATTRFQPLFLYESLSGVLGLIVLVAIGFKLRSRLRPGDLLLVFFVWYGVVRFGLETLRHDIWTFFSVPVAQLVSIAFVVASIVILMYRHRYRHPDDDPPTFPAVATWGAPGRPVDPEIEGQDEPPPEDDTATWHWDDQEARADAPPEVDDPAEADEAAARDETDDPAPRPEADPPPNA